ncbi:hypothetical protein [Glutamicibacter sp.]|uniref:hypothetical protein n=1 Tax=Glutamicibacter sp. TaxID=1931995 RepID=UPI002B49A0E1|nr:hypothetical protein [Glutamicibacter sp.]HJX78145.1 hypothetical protein [Glutamicibacter sp.]
MPRRRINVSVSHDEFEDLNNALEDHRDGFKQRAEEATNGFGLEPGYWSDRAQEVESLRVSVHEHSTLESDRRELSPTERQAGTDPRPSLDQDFDSR